MTYDDAIRILEWAKIYLDEAYLLWGDDYKAFPMAIEAIQKQTPKKCWKQHQSQDCGGVNFTIDIVCDRCDHSLRYRGQKYCDECGQKIDWSDIK